MKRRLIVLIALITSALATGLLSPSTSAVAGSTATRRYTTSDGAVSFRYPVGWFVEDDGWPKNAVFITNFKLGVRCCNLQDGEAKIDLFVEKGTKTLTQLRSEICSNSEIVHVRWCDIVRIDGVRWVWVLKDDMGIRARQVATSAGGRTYMASGGAPDGRFQAAGLDSIKEIFLSLELNGSSLPPTGTSAASALLVGMLLVGIGWLLRTRMLHRLG